MLLIEQFCVVGKMYKLLVKLYYVVGNCIIVHGYHVLGNTGQLPQHCQH